MAAWKQDAHHKPLILRGARQVGKTTVVNEFGKSFDNYLYFNMEDHAHRKMLELNVPLCDLMPMLFASLGLERKEGTTLIFIDEIQNSPKAIALLRYFYEQLPQIYVIAAGSLLENVVDVQVSFPVGRVQYLAMRPCTFYEFLGAMGEERLLNILSMAPSMAAPFNEQLMFWFNQYVLVGGMPEAVGRYAEKRDLLGLDSIYETLVQSYKDDVEKYVKGKKLTDVVRFILSYGWAFAGEAITLGNFANSGYKSREVGESFRLLEKAMLLELVYPTSSARQPVIPEMRRKPKLIWFDTGLVNFQAGIRLDLIGKTDALDSWRGHIAEQVTAQELLGTDCKIGHRRAFWARPNNGSEVDFIITDGADVIPVEVKSGTNAHLRSLQVFMDVTDEDIAVRVWSHPYSVDEVTTPHGKVFRLVNVPFYMIGRIHDIIHSLKGRQ